MPTQPQRCPYHTKRCPKATNAAPSTKNLTGRSRSWTRDVTAAYACLSCHTKAHTGCKKCCPGHTKNHDTNSNCFVCHATQIQDVQFRALSEVQKRALIHVHFRTPSHHCLNTVLQRTLCPFLPSEKKTYAGTRRLVKLFVACLQSCNALLSGQMSRKPGFLLSCFLTLFLLPSLI